MPPGVSQSAAVKMFQATGQSANTDLTLGYVDCPIGTFVSGYDCPACDFGSFSASLNQQACIMCQAGSAAASTGLSTCTMCSSGAYSATGASQCLACAAGAA